MNFDAKLRRQSIDPADLFHAHIGGMDVLARSLLVAEKIVSEGKLEQAVQERYAGWRTDLGERIAGGKLTLAQLSDLVLEKGLDPKPRSGRQEALENLANRYV
jgi:xylose isomerase